MRPRFDPDILTQESLGFCADDESGPENWVWTRVTHRAAGVTPIFTDDERFHIFFEALRQARENSEMEIHAFSVVPHRYHLLAKGSPRQVSRGVRELVSVFTQWVNLETSRSAPLLHPRSERVAIDEGSLSETLTNIHMAPVEEGCVHRPGSTTWSSYRCYVGSDPPPEWLNVNRILSHVGGPVAHRDSVTDRLIYLENASQPKHAVPAEQLKIKSFIND